MPVSPGFLRAIRLLRDDVPAFDAYPFSIPSIAKLDELELDPKVTFLVGENGSGKSTLI
jgi:predicted ATPase